MSARQSLLPHPKWGHMVDRVSRGRHQSRVRWALVVLAVGLATAGCSTHRVAATNVCGSVAKEKVVVVAPKRGAIGMAKLGLTPKELKALDKCS